jgi:phage shock protein PspC (stress-responsive transcriptional regulator)
VNPRRLYRSRRDRQLAGVAGGMAEYLEVDPTVVRLVWILSIFLGGFGILLYIIMAFIVPLDPRGMPGPGSGSWQAPGPSGTSPDGGGADGGAGPDGTATSMWTAPDGTATPYWTAPDQQSDARGGRGGLIIGVMLIVFGAIALANVLLPGWALGVALGPAFLVALGIALVVGAARRRAPEQTPEP